MTNRSVAAIQSELADVRRYLVDVPPHSGQGIRTELLDRINRLERELASARTAAMTPTTTVDRPLDDDAVGAYLTRLGHGWVDAPTSAALASLHRAHVTTVPFENLDIIDGVALTLTVDALYDKVVTRHRGGFCYELNGLFATLLRSVGFDVDMVAAHPVDDDTPEAVFEHLRLLVTTTDGDRFLADVGNGASWPAPLPLVDGASQDLGHAEVRLVRTGKDSHGSTWRTDTRDVGAEWEPEWVFDERPRRLDEFAARCRFQETSPDSHFTQGMICARTIDGGKLSLTPERLKITIHAKVEDQPVTDLDELLLTHFGIRR